MKKFTTIFYLIIMVVFISGCEKDAITIEDNSMQQEEKMGLEKMELFNDLILNNELINNKQTEMAKVDINAMELCVNTLYPSHAVGTSINNSDLYDYFIFDGTAGDVINIQVNRISDGMDPAMSLYFGSATDTEGVSRYNGGVNMIFLETRDDTVAHPSCFGDPALINYVLPYTGIYTLAVYDFVSCGAAPFDYEIVASGINCDIDGDGVWNSLDPHPDSILTAQLSIDGCNAGVSNLFVDPGTTMADEVNDVINSIWYILNNNNVRRGYDPQKKFQREMGILLTKWYYAGLITDRQKFEITKCVRRSRIFNQPS